MMAKAPTNPAVPFGPPPFRTGDTVRVTDSWLSPLAYGDTARVLKCVAHRPLTFSARTAREEYGQAIWAVVADANGRRVVLSRDSVVLVTDELVEA